jgi:hypothetical protein
MAFQPTTARVGGKPCVCSTRRPHYARRPSSSAGGGPARVVCLFGSPHPIRGRRLPGLARSRVAVDHRPAGRRRGEVDDASGGRRRSDRGRPTSRWQRSSSTHSFILRIPGKFSCKARVIPLVTHDQFKGRGSGNCQERVQRTARINVGAADKHRRHTGLFGRQFMR